MSAAEILVPAKFTTQMLQLIVTSVIYQSQYENVDSNDSTTSESLQAGVTLSIIFLAIEMGILFTGLTTQFQKTINHTPCLGNCPSCLVHLGYMAVCTHLDDFLPFLVYIPNLISLIPLLLECFAIVNAMVFRRAVIRIKN